MVRLQINPTQIAIKRIAHAVNHGGVGLQRHVDPQAVMKHAADHAAVAFFARLFFNNAGQNQRFIRRFQNDGGVTLCPSGCELFVHGIERALHHP